MRRSILAAAVVAAGLMTSGCTDEDATRETLRKAGFKDIAVGGYAMFACGEHDAFSTEFTATNGNGERVNGVVCCGWGIGWGKGCTVRF